MKLRSKIQSLLVEKIPTSFFLRVSEKRALKAYHRALKINPVYAATGGTNDIKDIETFRKLVPLSEKSTIFFPDLKTLPIHEKNYSEVKTILVSSGSSGNFSFGLKSEAEIKAVSDEADFALESYFSGKSKKTMIVNCLPMGSKVYCSIDCSDVGPHPARARALIAMAKRIGYEQVFVVSLGHIFLKELLEYDKSKYDFSWSNVFFFTGGEFFPESARSYFLKLLGKHDPADARPRVVNSGGITELMLNSLFFESPGLIKIREAMLKDEKLREKICGKATLYTPSIFFWNPLTSFIEIIDGFITITNLEKGSLTPLIRYKMDDRGQIVEHQYLRECLASCGLEDLAPKEQLPIIIFWGRGKSEQEHIIQEFLYKNDSAIKFLTSNFVIIKNKIVFQLKRGVELSEEKRVILSAFSEDLVRHLEQCEIQFIEFENFHYNVGLNYENKFNYNPLL